MITQMFVLQVLVALKEMEIYLDLTIRKHLSSLFMITQMYVLQVLVALKEMEIYLDLTIKKHL